MKGFKRASLMHSIVPIPGISYCSVVPDEFVREAVVEDLIIISIDFLSQLFEVVQIVMIFFKLSVLCFVNKSDIKCF